MASGLPHVRSLVVIKKRTRSTNPESVESPEDTVSHYLSSLAPQRAEGFGKLVRGHWGGSEIRNHWIRDALFEEDKTLSKNKHLAGNLAVLRCALLALKSRLAPERSWPCLFELSSLKAATPYNMICNNIFK